jgi:hypothetical protein
MVVAPLWTPVTVWLRACSRAFVRIRIGITRLGPQPVGSRLVFEDSRGALNLFNPVNDHSITFPDFSGKHAWVCVLVQLCVCDTTQSESERDSFGLLIGHLRVCGTSHMAGGVKPPLFLWTLSHKSLPLSRW